jgi:hypothetical protein
MHFCINDHFVTRQNNYSDYWHVSFSSMLSFGILESSLLAFNISFQYRYLLTTNLH